MPEQPESTTSPGIGDAAVQARTGRTWEEWFVALDEADAKSMTHREIVAVLRDRFRIGPWWQQMVTVAYERARGLRERHQKPQGFEISVTRTIEAPVAAAFAAWADESRRVAWLPAPLAVRSSVHDRSVRATWQDGSSVETTFTAKGEARCQLVVQHGRLKGAAAARDLKGFWREHLGVLKRLLEP